MWMCLPQFIDCWSWILPFCEKLNSCEYFKLGTICRDQPVLMWCNSSMYQYFEWLDLRLIIGVFEKSYFYFSDRFHVTALRMSLMNDSTLPWRRTVTVIIDLTEIDVSFVLHCLLVCLSSIICISIHHDFKIGYQRLSSTHSIQRFILSYIIAVVHVHSLLSIAWRKCGICQPDQASRVHFEWADYLIFMNKNRIKFTIVCHQIQLKLFPCEFNSHNSRQEIPNHKNSQSHLNLS